MSMYSKKCGNTDFVMMMPLRLHILLNLVYPKRIPVFVGLYKNKRYNISTQGPIDIEYVLIRSRFVYRNCSVINVITFIRFEYNISVFYIILIIV